MPGGSGREGAEVQRDAAKVKGLSGDVETKRDNQMLNSIGALCIHK